MKYRILLEFDTENVNDLGVLTKIDSLTVNDIPCILGDTFSEGVNTHAVFFNPFKMNLYISCSVDHKLTLKEYLNNISIQGELQNGNKAQHF